MLPFLPSLFEVVVRRPLSDQSRIRHLKCDEVKPTCLRCQKDHQKCDGYVQSGSKSKSDRANVYFPLRPSIRFGKAGPPLEELAFHHATHHTIRDIAESNAQRDFWYMEVQYLGHHVEAIRHALVALGSTHRSFLSQGPTNSTLDPSQADQTLTIRHYNLAIHHLQQAMSDPTPMNIRHTLICCVIFICLENLAGRYVESLRHLRSGARLLVSSLQSSEPRSSLTELARNADRRERLGDIAGLLSRVCLDTSLMVEDILISHITLFGPPKETNTKDLEPFTSLDSARMQLDQIEIDLDILGEATGRQRLHPHHSESGGLPWADTLEGPLQEYQSHFRAIYEKFLRWSEHWESFVTQHLKQALTAEDMQDVSFVCLHQKIWTVVFKHEAEVLYPTFGVSLEVGDLVAVIEQAELLQLIIASPNPIFTFDADLIPPLSYVADLTTDPTLLRRVAAVLRSLNRRENVWDSNDVAEIIEAAAFARESGLWSDESFSGGLLSMARSLAAASIPCIRPTNSTLLFAHAAEQCGMTMHNRPNDGETR